MKASARRVPRYRLYGLTVECPLPLPYAATATSGRPDVRLRPGSDASFAHIHRQLERHKEWHSWFFSHRLRTGETFVRWTNLFEFLVSRDGRSIQYRRLERATLESFGVYLVGQVLSFSLLARGVDALHGTVVAIDGRAVAFVGNCGHGKSTLAAAMLARGIPVLTDDVVALETAESGWRVHPGIPRLKLFPSVARKVLGMSRGGPVMNDGTAKRVFALGRQESVRRKLPLDTIYVLGDPDASCRSARVRVEPLSDSQAFLEVIRAAFNLLVLDRNRLAAQYAFARRLANDVRVRRLVYPRRLAALHSVCDAVIADLTAPRSTSLKSGRSVRTLTLPHGSPHDREEDEPAAAEEASVSRTESHGAR